MVAFILKAELVVKHLAYVGGVLDAQNVEIETWAPPVDQPVFCWSTPGGDTEEEKWRTAVVRDLDLYAPEDFTGPKDQVEIPGKGLFKVVGYAEDYTTGPKSFGFYPGVRINLKRAVDIG